MTKGTTTVRRTPPKTTLGRRAVSKAGKSLSKSPSARGTPSPPQYKIFKSHCSPSPSRSPSRSPKDGLLRKSKLSFLSGNIVSGSSFFENFIFVSDGTDKKTENCPSPVYTIACSPLKAAESPEERHDEEKENVRHEPSSPGRSAASTATSGTPQQTPRSAQKPKQTPASAALGNSPSDEVVPSTPMPSEMPALHLTEAQNLLTAAETSPPKFQAELLHDSTEVSVPMGGVRASSIPPASHYGTTPGGPTRPNSDAAEPQQEEAHREAGIADGAGKGAGARGGKGNGSLRVNAEMYVPSSAPQQHQMPPQQHQMPPRQHQMPPQQHQGQMPLQQHQMPPQQHQMPPQQHQMPAMPLGPQHAMPPMPIMDYQCQMSSQMVPHHPGMSPGPHPRQHPAAMGAPPGMSPMGNMPYGFMGQPMSGGAQMNGAPPGLGQMGGAGPVAQQWSHPGPDTPNSAKKNKGKGKGRSGKGMSDNNRGDARGWRNSDGEQGGKGGTEGASECGGGGGPGGVTPGRIIPGSSWHNMSVQQLARVRIIQRNLMYVTNLPASLGNEKVLASAEHLGQYGAIARIVLRTIPAAKAHQNNIISAYVTFVDKSHTGAAIDDLNGKFVHGKRLRASFGSNKYCNAFIRNDQCKNPRCSYVHQICPDVECFWERGTQRVPIS